MTQELTDANFKEKTATGLWAVDCWASWCGPCQVFGPIVEEVAGEMEGKVNVAKLNTEENQIIPGEYGISSIPTVLFIKDGEEIGRLTGAVSKEDLIAKINEAFGL